MGDEPGKTSEAPVARIAGGRLITPHSIVEDQDVFVESGVISRIEPSSGADEQRGGGRSIDAAGCWVVPGFVDLHLHGALGHDAMDATPEALAAIASFGVRHGVTSILATTMSASPEAIGAAIENVSACRRAGGASTILGLHLEGPYLSRDHRGAQPEAALRSPDPAEYERWLESGEVSLITVAPELPGALRLIEAGRAKGVMFAAGHSGASFEATLAAIDCGLSHATHVFNGMAPLHHRQPGVLGAVLADERVSAHAILDGVHLHPAAAKILVRAKGAERVALISDAMRATGLGNGTYDLGGDPITVQDGVARTAARGLAGSTLTLDQAVRNAVAWGLGIREAVAMATLAPAAAIGLGGRKGVLAAGADADIVLLDDELQVWLTIVGGRVAFERD